MFWLPNWRRKNECHKQLFELIKPKACKWDLRGHRLQVEIGRYMVLSGSFPRLKGINIDKRWVRINRKVLKSASQFKKLNVCQVITCSMTGLQVWLIEKYFDRFCRLRIISKGGSYKPLFLSIYQIKKVQLRETKII